MWSKTYGQLSSGTAGGRWQWWQHKTELDEVEWSVAYAPLGVTRHDGNRMMHYSSLDII